MKKLPTKKIGFVLLTLCFVASIFGNVVLYNTNLNLINEKTDLESSYSKILIEKKDVESLYTSLSDDYEIIQKENEGLKQQIEEKDTTISSLNKEIDNLKIKK